MILGENINVRKYKIRYYREFLPHPWDNVMTQIMKNIYLNGRYKEIFPFQFTLLNHFKYEEEKVNLYFFIYHSIQLSMKKVKHKHE